MHEYVVAGVGVYREVSGGWAVASESGRTYRIRYCGSGDGDPEYVAVWECDCPAGRHGRPCKHLRGLWNTVLPAVEAAEAES